ncbi:MAG TPA: hypothetical protein VNA14_02350 [Mycobacteriales bacterium]|nr:hypothetical protein [Mycobacteriales bacterium]
MRARLPVAVAALAVAALAAPSAAHPGHDRAPRAMRFEQPSLVTPELGGGLDPSVSVDSFGNVVVTASRDDATSVVAPDTSSTPPVRAASWRRVSVDEGKTWKSLPGLPGGADALVPGFEADVAVDGKGAFHVVDGNRLDLSLTAYDVRGRDRITRRSAPPTIAPTARLDTRPFIAVHGPAGQGVVITAADPVSDPVTIGAAPGSGFGPGRYVVYTFRDGLLTAAPTGYPLKDSFSCRPVADPRPGSTRIVIACLDGNGTLYAYVSIDDGKTFERYAVSRYVANDPNPGRPSVTIARDGTIHVLISEGVVFVGAVPTASRLRLFSSKDGRRWSTRDVTDVPGIYRQAAISAGPDGRLGVAAYFRPNPSAKWNVVAGSMRASERTVYLTAFAHDEPVAEGGAAEPPGSHLSLTWSAARRMHVSWSRTDDAADSGLLHEVWHARSLPV